MRRASSFRPMADALVTVTTLAVIVTISATGCGGTATVENTSTVVATRPPETASAPDTTVPAPVVTDIAPGTTGAPGTTVPPTTDVAPTTVASPPPVFDFATVDDIDGWNVVNDTVMGGVSTGQLSWDTQTMVFTGDLSLDNNGGFASVRSPRLDPAAAAGWENSTGLGVVVGGDGRVWTVEVLTDSDDGGWISTIPTTPSGEMTAVELPWTGFDAVTRFLDPRQPTSPLDPTRIVSVAFFLVDGIEAPFRLEVASVS